MELFWGIATTAFRFSQIDFTTTTAIVPHNTGEGKGAGRVSAGNLGREGGVYFFCSEPKFGVSPPCAVKTCAVRPVFAPVVGELRAPHPSKCPRAHEANASPGEQSEAPRRRRKPGQEQHPGAENQDSQHMLNQPRRSFPEIPE